VVGAAAHRARQLRQRDTAVGAGVEEATRLLEPELQWGGGRGSAAATCPEAGALRAKMGSLGQNEVTTFLEDLTRYYEPEQLMALGWSNNQWISVALIAAGLAVLAKVCGPGRAKAAA